MEVFIAKHSFNADDFIEKASTTQQQNRPYIDNEAKRIGIGLVGLTSDKRDLSSLKHLISPKRNFSRLADKLADFKCKEGGSTPTLLTSAALTKSSSGAYSPMQEQMLGKAHSAPSVCDDDSHGGLKETAQDNAQLNHNSLLLTFSKGDEFEVLSKDGKKWWPVRALTTDALGFVPANYLTCANKRDLQVDTSKSSKANRKAHLKALAERQSKAGLQHPDSLYPTMIPEPDYSDGEEDGRKVDGLIIPKKLRNPCKESIERQNLHRELLFNQKIGKNVLNQKTELQKAMEKRSDQKARKELEQQQQSNLTPFQKAMEERAKKMETVDNKEEPETESSSVSEFMKVHAKVRSRLSSK